jgi:hypothetical protein
MTLRIPESPFITWLSLIGISAPPRDPNNNNDEDEEDEDKDEEDEKREPGGNQRARRGRIEVWLSRLP